MYIAPNTTIRLLRGIPLEPDYINTLYFADKTTQSQYFISKTKYNLQSQSYQRVNKGICRVNYKAEDIYDCNYMMFQNTSFGDKWFYAFITSIDYVNNVTADVHYEIDVMQSWLIDMVLTQCWVEREHTITDNIGENIMPEPVDLGELVFNYYTKLYEDLDNYAIVMAVTTDEFHDVGSSGGNVVNGLYSATKLWVEPATLSGANDLSGKISNDYAQKPDEIVAIYMCPIAALPRSPIDQYGQDDPYWLTDSDYLHNKCPEYILPSSDPSTGERGYYKISTNDFIDHYKPKNNKLYTYPYNFFHIDNGNGRELNLRYEFFNDGNGLRNLSPQFRLTCNPLMPVSCVLRPYNYKGITSLNGGDLSPEQTDCAESIDLTAYPLCTWNVESYEAWLAQNSVPEAISVLSKGAEIAVAGIGLATPLITGVGSAGALGGLVASSVIGSVSQIATNHYKASAQADVCKGSLNNSNINFCSKKQNFFIGRISVNRYHAAMIDNFFDRFGYTINRVKTPNTHSRPHWNYVKTIGSNIGGNIPADDKRKIDSIFNNGITFWKNPANVDNYSLNNAPT